MQLLEEYSVYCLNSCSRWFLDRKLKWFSFALINTNYATKKRPDPHGRAVLKRWRVQARTWNTRQIDQNTYILGRSATLCRDDVLNEVNFSSFNTVYVLSYVVMSGWPPEFCIHVPLDEFQAHRTSCIYKFVGLPIHLQVLNRTEMGSSYNFDSLQTVLRRLLFKVSKSGSNILRRF